MIAKPDLYMPIVIADYLGDTMHLTRDQHGGYLLLLMAYWRRGGPLPDDDSALAQIAKATPQEWRRLRKALSPFFTIDGGHWAQGRADKELERARKLIEDRSTAGRRGAQSRWQTHSKPIANGWQGARQTACQTDATQTHTHTHPPSNPESLSNGTFKRVGSVVRAGFEE